VERRSVRQYSDEPLRLPELAQLLWAAQGITSPRGFRTSPSAGALYPLEVYAVVGSVEDIAPGIYWYHTREHELVSVADGDQRDALADAALGQSFVGEAAVDLVVTAIYERTTVKYGERGVRYVHIEAGHAAQNVLLQATALGLGAVPVGAFLDQSVARILDLPDDENPLYIIPVGRRQ
jgi:SagB-type dehydrogenase family enzyme